MHWESGERPAPFAGTVEIDATPAENDASMSAPAPSVSVNPAQGGQEPPIWEGDSTTIVSPPAAQPVPDVMEDLLWSCSCSPSAPHTRRETSWCSSRASMCCSQAI